MAFFHKIGTHYNCSLVIDIYPHGVYHESIKKCRKGGITLKTESYEIEGMSCAACSSAVERVTRRLTGVAESNVNLMTGKMSISYDETAVAPEDIMAAVTKAGFGVCLEAGQRAAASKEEDLLKPQRRALIWSAIFSALLLYLSMGQMLVKNLPIPDIFSIETHAVNFAVAQLLLTVPVLFIWRERFYSGFSALVRRSPNMDSLVAIGCAASFLYSLVMTFLITDNPHHSHHLYYESAAVVLTLIGLGKFFEQRSKQKTKGAITKLMELSPETAVLVRDGVQSLVPTESLAVGDTVLVKPGARVPLDGIVISGSSGVDEAMLTGESMPVFKAPGDPLIGGSINQNGALYAEITRTGGDTTLAKIIKFVEDAQGKKAPISKTADKVAGVFVPVVMAIAVLAAAVWLLAGQDLSFALRVFTGVLVIACPCALGLATPTAIMVGTGLGAKYGILIRSGEALEITHKTQVVVLDKTGTVTEGKPVVTRLFSTNGAEDHLLRLAVLAEGASDHPLAKAVMDYAAEKGFSSTETLTEFENISGKGVRGRLSDGKKLLAGSALLLQQAGVDTGELDEAAQQLSAQGQSVIFVALGGMLSGLLAVADTVKPSAASAIAKLNAGGIETVLLTGDNRRAAEYIAGLVGIKRVYAEVLPEEKASIVEKLQQGGKTVMMVGDGINDAPALAQADIGCAIGSGSDIAIESADVVLMKGDLVDVFRAIKLSRLTIRNVRQNLFWAFCYNTLGIPIAAGVLYPFNQTLLSPMLAGLAMSLSSVFVVGNALRLRRKKL